MAAEWIVAVAGVSLTVVVWALFAARQRGAAVPAPGQIRRIRIKGGYQPAEVHVRAGEPTRLIFRREETAHCSERVVFPDYGLSVMLPPFEDVAVDLPPSDPGEHAFSCQMEMLQGRLIVDGEVAT